MRGRPPVSWRVRVGRAALRRIQAGGPRAVGRPAATTAEWTAIREMVLARAHWACQACGSRTRLDVHHVLKRAQGGSDFALDLLVALCRACHDRTDAPYARGRLIVTPLGGERFQFTLVRGAGKGARTVLDRWESLRPPNVDGLHEAGRGRWTSPTWANRSEMPRQDSTGRGGAALPMWAKPSS